MDISRELYKHYFNFYENMLILTFLYAFCPFI